MGEQERQIREKMQALAKKWEGKETVPGSSDDNKKKIDRMIYRNLQRQLKKIKSGEPEDIVEYAKKLFGVEESTP